MIGSLILYGLLSSFLLGGLVLAVVLQWRSPSPIHRSLFFILFGLAVVLCTLGQLGLAGRLVC
jgi:hypothetical protein